jgi:hypothetical protein
MKYIIITLTLLALIVSCNTRKKTNSFFSKPGDIKADEYVIGIDKDTTLATKNGALLYIPKGSLSIETGNSITLEIKEVYTPAQMILSGLTTRTEYEQLSSGGMIYISVAKGQNVKINKPIQVAIPSGYLDKKMQLYKGEKDADGNIVWKNPVLMPENNQLTAKEEGAVLFQQKCGACHGIGKQFSGPDLAHVTERFSRYERRNIFYNHLVKMDTTKLDYTQVPGIEMSSNLNDSSKSRESGKDSLAGSFQNYFTEELYFCNLTKFFGSPDQSKLKHVSKKELRNIYRYIKEESNRMNLPLPVHAWLDESVDSCKTYASRLQKLNKLKQIANVKRENLVDKNGRLVEVKSEVKQNIKRIKKWLPPLEEFEEAVTPENISSAYYQFTITSFGWFNCDMLSKDIPGVEESELWVKLTGSIIENVKVYLFLPGEKIYLDGGIGDKGTGYYAFNLTNGKIFLPQKQKGYIIGMAETKNAPAFALQEFTVNKSQEIELSLHTGAKEEFEQSVNALSLDQLKIMVRDSDKADRIRELDTKLENLDNEIKKTELLKPKKCDCNCIQNNFQPLDATVTESPKQVDIAK